MRLRAERRGDEFVIPIPLEVLRSMGLVEGAAVALRPVEPEGNQQEEAVLRTEPLRHKLAK
jgi:hypothetical protein